MNKSTENTYYEVTAIIHEFSKFYPIQGHHMADLLEDVHQIPEIGDALYEEEFRDLNDLIKIMRENINISTSEKDILAKAQELLKNIEMRIESTINEQQFTDRLAYRHDFEHLRQLSDDPSFQNCVNFAYGKLKANYNNHLMHVQGSIIFHNTLDVLCSLYYFCLVMDGFNENDHKIIAMILYDAARNISPQAAVYLANKEPAFAAIAEQWSEHKPLQVEQKN